MEKVEGLPVLEIPKRKKYRIRPRRGWVLVRKITQDIEKVGDVFVDKSQARSLRGEVIEAADKADGSPTDLLAGDVVIITAFGMEIEDLEEMTGEKHLVMLRDEEVYASGELIED